MVWEVVSHSGQLTFLHTADTFAFLCVRLGTILTLKQLVSYHVHSTCLWPDFHIGVEGDGGGVTHKEAAMFVATKEGHLDGELGLWLGFLATNTRLI